MKTMMKMGVVLATMAVGLGLVGCGSEGLPAEDAKSEQARAQAAKDQVELAHKSGGDYDKLTSEDKARADKLFGDGTKAKAGLARMGGGPGAGAPAGLAGTGTGHSAF